MRRNKDKQKIIEALYYKYRYLLFKVTNDILHDQFLAEDAIHNTFVRICKRSDLIEDDDIKSKNLLLIMCKHEAIDLWRKRKRQSEHESYIDDIVDIEDICRIEKKNVESDLMELFKSLPGIYQDVFILKYVNDMDDTNIAKVLRITEANVRKRLSRGKQLIRTIIVEGA